MKRRLTRRQLRRRADTRREIAKGFGLALGGLALACVILVTPFAAEFGAKRFPIPFQHSQAVR